jgi:limonene-1,2-epoxide hydrolase
VEGDEMSAEEVVRAELSAWSSLDADEIMKYFAPDAIWDDPSHGSISGHEEIRKAVEGFLSPMTQADSEIRNLLGTDHIVMTERVDRFIYDGKNLDVPIMGIFEVVGDKIVAWRDYYNMAPPPES